MAASSIRITGTVKHFVLEQKKLHDKMAAGERSALLRSGGLLRRIAQRSIRPGGKKHKRSAPGEPIRWHVRPGIRGNIYFAFDTQTRSVVVGPLGFRNSPVPEVLEQGGFITMFQRNHGKIVRKRVFIKPRPTMKLALQATADSGKMASNLKDSIK